MKEGEVRPVFFKAFVCVFSDGDVVVLHHHHPLNCLTVKLFNKFKFKLFGRLAVKHILIINKR